LRINRYHQNTKSASFNYSFGKKAGFGANRLIYSNHKITFIQIIFHMLSGNFTKSIYLLWLFAGASLAAYAQSFALDVGPVYRGVTNPGVVKEYAGYAVGFSWKMATQFELRLSGSFFSYETYRKSISQSTTPRWTKPSSKIRNGNSFISSKQFALTARWRPRGFQRGLFLGPGISLFQEGYSIHFQRVNGQPYLMPSSFLIFVPCFNMGFDFHLLDGHSIELSGNLEFDKYYSHTDQLFRYRSVLSGGIGWRWAP
jgi:hypothetical protein